MYIITLFHVIFLRHFCQAAEDGLSGIIHPIGIANASLSELIYLSQAVLEYKIIIYKFL